MSMGASGMENEFLILNSFKDMGLQVKGRGFIQRALTVYIRGYIQIFMKLNNSVKIFIICRLFVNRVWLLINLCSVFSYFLFSNELILLLNTKT